MSISEAKVSDFNLGDLQGLNLTDFALPEAALSGVRHELYHSTGPGFVIFRNFLNADQVEHLRVFWGSFRTDQGYATFEGKHQFVAGCGNFVSRDPKNDNATFHNFLWNVPIDELTWTTAWMVQGLRNRISGRPFFAETIGNAGRVVNNRVVLTRNAETWIAPHRDYFNYDRRLEKGLYDLSRLQATLVLARKGEDYQGRGFVFEKNSGETISFGTDVEVHPGDLIVWRYNNLHSVEGVSSKPGQLGFLRFLYPLETLAAVAPVSRPSLLQRGLSAIKRKVASL
jgi:hypothetical protein